MNEPGHNKPEEYKSLKRTLCLRLLQESNSLVSSSRLRILGRLGCSLG